MKIRSLHPEFFTDKKLAQLPFEARILFAGLWCHANDYGHGRHLPKNIEGAVFPHDIIDIVDLLTRLEREGLVRVYEVDGERFYEIPNWGVYQSPKYQGKTKIPAPTSDSYVSEEVLPNPGLFSPKLGEDWNKLSPGVGVGVGVGVAALTEEPSFEVFHRQRAAKEAETQKADGLAVRSLNGLAGSIAGRSDFHDESRRLFAHVDCRKCGGAGFIPHYSPGSGGGKTECVL